MTEFSVQASIWAQTNVGLLTILIAYIVVALHHWTKHPWEWHRQQLSKFTIATIIYVVCPPFAAITAWAIASIIYIAISGQPSLTNRDDILGLLVNMTPAIAGVFILARHIFRVATKPTAQLLITEE